MDFEQLGHSIGLIVLDLVYYLTRMVASRRFHDFSVGPEAYF